MSSINTQDILNVINRVIREEKGSRVKLEDKLQSANLDSFGYTVLFLNLDDKYGIFNDIPEDVDPFSTIDWKTITVQEVINKCL